jgi:hypothetical protein
MRVLVIALVMFVAMPAHAVPEPRLWWPLDDGLDPTEALVGDFDGTLNGGGGPRYVVKDNLAGTVAPLDCNGDALRFDGDDYVEIAPGVAGLDGFAALTLAAWVRLDAYGGAIIAKYDTHNQWVSYYFSVQSVGASSYVRTLVGGAGGVGQFNEVYVGADSEHDVVALDTWTHVAVVWSGGTNFAIYVNGAPVTSTPFSNRTFTGMYSGTTPISLGSVTSVSGREVGRSDYLQGDLDDPRIWDVALTAEDIAVLAAGGATIESCAMCPVDCQEEPIGEVFYGVVERADGTLGSIQCWHDADGIDCRTDLSGALLVGPPECAP